MLEVLTRHWWAVVLRGAAAILFGLMAVIWPGITVLVLVTLFGAYALVDGVFALGAAIFGQRGAAGLFSGRTGVPRGWLVVEGIAGVLTGIITFAWPGITTVALLWVIAAWALVTGVLEIVAAVRLRREIRGEWLLILGGALSVIFGILLAVWPASGAVALVVLIGAYAMVFGVVLVTLGLRLRRLRREGAVTGVHRSATV